MGKITLEDKLEAIQKMRPIDDIFFAVLAANKKVCTEILRTILDDKELVVEDVITQASIRNIYARSVTLDALCTLGNGRKCNIEVQRSDNDDHLRRVRFNASSITVKESNPGEHFTDVIELYIVYISEFDMFQGGYDTTDCSVLIHSRNPKTPQIHSFFYEKWLLFGVLVGQIGTKSSHKRTCIGFCAYLPLVSC